MISWSTISLSELAGYVSDELRKRGIDAILVGGACVTIYSQNRYESFDLDFVTFEDTKKIKKALKELGFKEKGGAFYHDDCKLMVEFVTPPVAIGKEFITSFKTVKVSTGTIKMLRAEDSVKDRLASYFYWNDRQGLIQAIDICSTCKINLEEVQEWAIKEGYKEKFQKIASQLKNPN